MLRNFLLSIILFSAAAMSAPVHAQQSSDGELHLSAGAIVTAHLTQAYASCPAGTHLKVKVSNSIDSRVNKTGDPVNAILAAPLSCNNQIILPAGTQIMGDFVELAAADSSQASSYGIELTYVAANVGSRSIHAVMESSQTSARNQSGRAAAPKAGAKNDGQFAGSQSRRPAASPGPLFYLTLAASLAQGMSQQTLANEAAERGIDFYFDDGDAEWLHAMGATDALLNALHRARYNYVDYASEKGKWQAEAARDEAIAQSAEARRPEDPGIHWLLGIALQFQQKQADSMPEFRQAIVLKPDLSCAHRGLAESLIESGQKEEALSEARESVRLLPNGPGAQMVLGYVLAQNGDPQGGIAALREAVRISPDYFITHYALADGLLLQKNTDEAIHEFREAVRLNPVSEPSHFGLGRALFAKPDYDAATFEFREALRLHPDDSNARTWLAGTLYNAGQSEEAAAEAHTALLYNPKVNGAKLILNSAKGKLSVTAGAPAAQPSSGGAAPSSGAYTLQGTWKCTGRSVYWNGDSRDYNFTVTFLLTPDPNPEICPTCYEAFNGNIPMEWAAYKPWTQSGSSFSIPYNYSGGMSGPPLSGTFTDTSHIQMNHPAGSGTAGAEDGAETDTCERVNPNPAPNPTENQATQSQSASNHPPYDDKCIRMGAGNLGAVTFTNICTEPIDLKWCYRQHGAGGDWHCSVTPKLMPNHTLESPFCYQCSYDGRAAAFLSSRGLLGSLPSDAEVASWSGSGAPSQNSSSAGADNGAVPNDGQRRWHLTNPSQNWDTVFVEVHGRSGDSTSDDWNDETPIITFSLKPGEQQLLTCNQWFSLDVRWYTSSSSNPQTDIYYASLVCYANNFVWNNNHNLREYAFPRQ